MEVNPTQGELMEEDTVQKLFEDMEIRNHGFVPSNAGLEEATNGHIFC
jgi:hypothetical protein